MCTRVQLSGSLLLGIGMLAATPAAPGTLMPDALLATLTEVRLNVSPALAYEPIAGLDLNELRSEISARCRAALNGAGLEIEDSAEAYLLVVVRHAWEDERREKVALLTTAELFVLGEPVGGAPSELPPRPRSLLVWQDDYLELIATVPPPRQHAIVILKPAPSWWIIPSLLTPTRCSRRRGWIGRCLSKGYPRNLIPGAVVATGRLSSSLRAGASSFLTARS